MPQCDDARPAPHGRRSGAWPVLLVATFAFTLLQLAHNRHLFTRPIHEDLDYAANSLLILKAKRLELLHGHYSRMGFYHPGPALLYVLAASEWVFHDQLGVVPAPHNAHMIGHMILNAALLAVALAIVSRAAGRWAAAAAAVAFLVYLAREGQLSSHWFAYTFFLVYLPFQVAAASVAAGRTAHLGWLALTAGLAVHSHASLILFVVPISLYAIARLWARGGEARAWRAWGVFAAVVGLFVLPIVLHTALNYPGEIRRYMEHGRTGPHAAGNAEETARYMLRTLTDDSPLGWPLAAGVFAAAGAAVLMFPPRGRRFAAQVLAVGMLTSGAMVYYAARGVDDYQNTYLGIFYGSVLLLAWTLVGMRLALLARGATCRVALAAVGAGAAAWAGATGNFTNPYVGAPGAPALAEAVCADPRWQTGPPLLSVEGDGWRDAGAILIQLERRGRRPWVFDPIYQILYSDAFRPDDRPLAAMWQIDVAGVSAPAVPARRVLAEFPLTTVRELETRCPFGGAVPLGGRGRLPGAKPLDGWSLGDDRLMPVRERAVMLLDLGPCPAGAVRLTLRGSAVPAPHTDVQRVRVAVNGEPVGEVAFPVGPAVERSLVFAGEVLTRRSPVWIEFTFPDVPGQSASGPRARTRLSIELTGMALTAGP